MRDATIRVSHDLHLMVCATHIGRVAEGLAQPALDGAVRGFVTTREAALRHRLPRHACRRVDITREPVAIDVGDPRHLPRAGAGANIACRPDLARKIIVGGAFFLFYYALLSLAFQVSAPGYVERVWNWERITGLRFLGVPIEEILFAAAFGCYWAGAFEHLFWTRPARRQEGGAPEHPIKESSYG